MPKPKKQPNPLRCSIDRQKLSTALSSLCLFAKHDDDAPIANECVHLVAESGRLHLSAARVDMSGSTTLNATIDEEGECIVPAEAFRDAVAGCQGARVTLALMQQGAERSLHVMGDLALVNLIAPEMTDTPDVPAIDTSVLRPVEDGFRDLIRATLYAISTNEDRYHLCGVHLKAEGRRFVATATDGHRLARMEAPASLFPEEWEGILRPEAAKALLRLPGDVSSVGRVEAGRFAFVVGGLTMTARPVEAQFPPADQVIPTGPANRFAVDREALLTVCKAAQKFTGIGEGVKLTVVDEAARLTFDDPLVGHGEWTVPVRFVETRDVTPWIAGVNPKFLAQALAAMTAERVIVAITGALDPVVVRDGGGRLAVIMPLRLDEANDTAPQKGAA